MSWKFKIKKPVLQLQKFEINLSSVKTKDNKSHKLIKIILFSFSLHKNKTRCEKFLINQKYWHFKNFYLNAEFLDFQSHFKQSFKMKTLLAFILVSSFSFLIAEKSIKRIKKSDASYTVSIQLKDVHKCSGALISEQHVLSAATCECFVNSWKKFQYFLFHFLNFSV